MSLDVADESIGWKSFWSNMVRDGWTSVRVTGLSYYFHPSCEDRIKSAVLKEGKEGEDSFKGMEALMRYARENLGYKGLLESTAFSSGGNGRKKCHSRVAATTWGSVDPKKTERTSWNRQKQTKEKSNKALKDLQQSSLLPPAYQMSTVSPLVNAMRNDEESEVASSFLAYEEDMVGDKTISKLVTPDIALRRSAYDEDTVFDEINYPFGPDNVSSMAYDDETVFDEA